MTVILPPVTGLIEHPDRPFVTAARGQALSCSPGRRLLDARPRAAAACAAAGGRHRWPPACSPAGCRTAAAALRRLADVPVRPEDAAWRPASCSRRPVYPATQSPCACSEACDELRRAAATAPRAHERGAHTRGRARNRRGRAADRLRGLPGRRPRRPPGLEPPARRRSLRVGVSRERRSTRPRRPPAAAALRRHARSRRPGQPGRGLRLVPRRLVPGPLPVADDRSRLRARPGGARHARGRRERVSPRALERAAHVRPPRPPHRCPGPPHRQRADQAARDPEAGARLRRAFLLVVVGTALSPRGAAFAVVDFARGRGENEAHARHAGGRITLVARSRLGSNVFQTSPTFRRGVLYWRASDLTAMPAVGHVLRCRDHRVRAAPTRGTVRRSPRTRSLAARHSWSRCVLDAGAQVATLRPAGWGAPPRDVIVRRCPF